MNGRQFAKFLARDLHCPCGCVGKEDTYVPQHRAGRGMGGGADHPANIIVLCSYMNGLIESNAAVAARARRNGWKLFRWQRPEEEPFYDHHDGQWHMIDDNFNRTITERKAA